MLLPVAKAIINFLHKHHAIRPEDRDVYVYGCDLALYTFFSTVGLLIIGLGFDLPIETGLCIGLFYLNQTMGGGYHASTHLRCFLVMTVGILMYLSTFFWQIPHSGCVLLGVFSLNILFFLPLVLHKNKRYLLVRERILSRRSRVVVIIQLFVFVLVSIFDTHHFTQALAIIFMLCATSRCTAEYIHRHEIEAYFKQPF